MVPWMVGLGIIMMTMKVLYILQSHLWNYILELKMCGKLSSCWLKALCNSAMIQ